MRHCRSCQLEAFGEEGHARWPGGRRPGNAQRGGIDTRYKFVALVASVFLCPRARRLSPIQIAAPASHPLEPLRRRRASGEVQSKHGSYPGSGSCERLRDRNVTALLDATQVSFTRRAVELLCRENTAPGHSDPRSFEHLVRSKPSGDTASICLLAGWVKVAPQH